MPAGTTAPVRFTQLPFRITSLVAGGGYLWAAGARGGVARIGPLPRAVRASAGL
jgi:hypothetical protein